MQNLGGVGGWGGRKEPSRKHDYASKSHNGGKQMEGMGKSIEGEVSKGIISDAQRFGAKMHAGTKGGGGSFKRT